MYGKSGTDREIEDFNLKLEVNLLSGGNQGIFLRETMIRRRLEILF